MILNKKKDENLAEKLHKAAKAGEKVSSSNPGGGFSMGAESGDALLSLLGRHTTATTNPLPAITKGGTGSLSGTSNTKKFSTVAFEDGKTTDPLLDLVRRPSTPAVTMPDRHGEDEKAKSKTRKAADDLASYAQTGAFDVEKIAGMGKTLAEAKKESDAAEARINTQAAVEKFSNANYEDTFAGQFGANKTLGRINQDLNAAYGEYLRNPTAENKAYAETLERLAADFQLRNAAALDDEGAVLPWISKSAANYLPQLWDQLKAQAAGGLAGAAAGSVVPGLGTAMGAKAGIVAATGAQSYTQMQGAAFRELLAAGLDFETAQAAANDEAVISSLIEMGDTMFDLATLGTGKLIAVLGKGGVKAVAKGAAGEAAESAVEKLLKALGKYGLNIVGEMAEEGAQQTVSIANRQRAASGETGVLDLLGKSKKTLDAAAKYTGGQNWKEITEAAKEGGKIAAMFGGVTMASNAATNAAITHQVNKSVGQTVKDTSSNFDVVQEGLGYAEGTEQRKLADRLGNKIDTQGTDAVTEAEYGALKVRIERDKAAKAAAENVARQATTEEAAPVQQAQESAGEVKVASASIKSFMDAGDNAKVADTKSGIWDRVKSGDTTLTNTELRKLDLRSASTRAIIEAETGLQVPQTTDTKTLLAFARSVVDQYAQQNEQKAAMQEQVNATIQQAQEAAAAQLAELEAQLQAQADAAEQRAAEIQQTSDEQAATMAADIEEQAKAIEQQPEGIRLSDGTSVTPEQFAAQYKAANPGKTDAQVQRVTAEAVTGSKMGTVYPASMLKQAQASAQESADVKKRSSVDAVEGQEQRGSEAAKSPSEGHLTDAQRWTEAHLNNLMSKRKGAPKIVVDAAYAGKDNGHYDKTTNTVVINGAKHKTQFALTYVLGHELVHKVSDVKSRHALTDSLFEFMAKTEGAGYVAAEQAKGWLKYYNFYTKKFMEQYKMSQEKAEAAAEHLLATGEYPNGAKDEDGEYFLKVEVAADFMSRIFTDPRSMRRFAAENPAKADTWRDWVNDRLNDLIKHTTKADETSWDMVRKMHDIVTALNKGITEAEKPDLVTEEAAKPAPVKESIPAGDEGATYEENGERYSVKSMKHDVAEGKMFDDLVAVGVFNREEADLLKENLTKLVEYMVPNAHILDMNEAYGKGNRPFSSYKPNNDPLYKISLDFSTLCRKRLMTQYVIEQLQLRENRPMSAEEQIAIRSMLLDYRQQEQALQVACAMCYVEAARLKAPKQMEAWFNNTEAIMRKHFAKKNGDYAAEVKKAQEQFKLDHGYKANTPKKGMRPADVTAFNEMSAQMRKAYAPTAEQQAIIDTAVKLPRSTFLTAANLTALSVKHPEIYAAYTDHIRASTRSKSLEGDVPYYYGDSRGPVSDAFIKGANAENGMRFDSWSDFQMKHMLDMITAVIDLSVRGSKMHGYTKFPEMVRIFGKTGMQFNLSGVTEGTGLDENGGLIFSDTESIPIEEAKQLREDFPETAGLQCIGVNDDHIRALLRSDLIDYVIPYHTSGMNATLRKMAGIYKWKDYTTTQHAVKDPNAKKPAGAEKWLVEPVWSEFYVGEGEDGYDIMQKTAQRYIDMCHARGLIPKFNDFTDEDGYWKLLVDRKMINQKTGAIIEQQPVKPIFDFDLIKKEIDREVSQYDPQLEERALQHVVDNFDAVHQRVADLKKNGPKKAMATLGNEVLQAYAEGSTRTATEKRYSADTELGEKEWFTKSFADQIEDYKAGKLNAYDTLIVGPTPKVFQKIGLNALPVTFGTGHLKDIISGTKADHDFGVDILKQLPKALQTPVAIVASNTRSGTSVVAMLELSHKGKRILCAAHIDGHGQLNGLRIDSNAATTVHKRTNITKMLADAIQNDTASNIRVYYVDKAKATRWLNGSGLQLPRRMSIPDGFVHSIRDSGSPVKPKFSSVLETAQFKKWFGDWQNSTGKHSVVVNSDGTPAVVYHGTPNKFDRFKRGDIGIHVGSTKEQAQYRLKDSGDKGRIMELYADIKIPLYAAYDFGDWHGKNVAEMLIETDQFEESENRAGIEARLAEIAAMPDGAATDEALRKYLQELGYDGIVYENQFETADRFSGNYDYSYIVFEPNQLKSVHNVGTYSRDTDHLRFSVDSEGRALTKEQQEFFKDSVVRDAEGRLTPVYHGTPNGGFTEFKLPEYLSVMMSARGAGYYFTDKKNARQYMKPIGKTGGASNKQMYKVYLNITNPLVIAQDSPVSITKEQFKEIIRRGNYEWFRTNGLPQQVRGDKKANQTMPFEELLDKWADQVIDAAYYDEDILAEMVRAYKGGSNDILLAMQDVLGYDGVRYLDKYGDIWVAWSANQIKNTDNIEPTNAPDIRYSVDSDSGSSPDINPDTGYERGSVMDSAMRIYRATGREEAVQMLNDYITALEQIAEEHNKKIRDAKAVDALSPKLTEQRIASNKREIENLIKRFGEMPQTSGAQQEVHLPKKIDSTTKVRGAVQTLNAHSATNEAVANQYVEDILAGKAGVTYKPITDNEALEKVRKQIRSRKGFEEMRREWNDLVESDKLPSKEQIAKGEALYIQACSEKRVADAMQLAAEIAVMGTRAGQAVQAFSLLKRMTPTGKAYYIKRTVDSLNRDKLLDQKGIKLTLDKALLEDLLTAQTQEEIQSAEDALIADLAKQIPSTFADKVNLWRYTAMLTNPRTHVRNVLGNAVFAPLRAAKDFTAALAEEAFIKDQSQRTKSVNISSEWLDFAKKDAELMKEELQGSGRYGLKDKILDKRRVFNEDHAKTALGKLATKTVGNAVEKIGKVNSDLMTEEDWGLCVKLFDARLPGLRNSYAKALAGFLQARGFTVEQVYGENSTPEGRAALDEARTYAVKEAYKATYRDASKLAMTLNQFNKNLGGVGRVMMGGVLPFTKTPINVARRAIEYSPVGVLTTLTDGLYKLSKEQMTTAEFIDSLCAGLTGSAVLAAGYFLGKAGILVGSMGDDEEDEFKELQGYQEYSVNAFGKNYTLDWASPVAMPLFVGAELHEILEERGDGMDMWAWIDASKGLLNPLLAMSMLSGLNDTLSAVQYNRDSEPIPAIVETVVGSYMGQFIPSVAGALTRTWDDSRRTTFTPSGQKGAKNWADRWIQTNIQGKIPFLSGDRMLYVDAWGRTDTEGRIAMRGIENFLSPGYLNDIQTSSLEDELSRLAKAANDTGVYPSLAQKSFKVDKKTYAMSQDEYQAHLIDRGQTSYRLASDIIHSPGYAALSEDEKAAAIKLAYEYASQTAKYHTNSAYSSREKWQFDMDNYVANGGDAAEFLMLKARKDVSKTDMSILAMRDPRYTSGEVSNLLLAEEGKVTWFDDPYTSGYVYNMTDRQQEKYNEILLRNISSGYAELLQQEDLNSLSDDELDKLVSQMLRAARSATKSEMSDWLYGQGIDPTPKA